MCEIYEPDELLGKVQVLNVEKGRYVANLFGQKHYGRNKQHTNYIALGDSLSCLRKYAEKHSMSVALPYGIGSGLADGDWNIIYDNIKNVFEGYEVVLYKLQ